MLATAAYAMIPTTVSTTAAAAGGIALVCAEAFVRVEWPGGPRGGRVSFLTFLFARADSAKYFWSQRIFGCVDVHAIPGT